MEIESSERLETTVARSAVCASAFGAACGAGLGLRAILTGMWAGPALFVGGALLALPPLYLASSVSGTSIAPVTVARSALGRMGRATLVLVGLAPAALLFSTTLHGELATKLLYGVVGAAFAFGSYAVAESLIEEQTSLPQRLAFACWVLFTWLLGARMIGVIAHAALGGVR